MDGTSVGFISIGAVLMLNLVGVAYSYGKQTQKLNDLCRRMGLVEEAFKGMCSHNDKGKES